MLVSDSLLLDKLASIFPTNERFLSIEDSQKDLYGRDWTKFFVPRPCAVAFPRNAEEVARTLEFCQAEGLAVVPSGGRTGLSGGAVAAQGELVVSLEKLNQMGPVEPLGATLEVGAGAITQAVHDHTRPAGLTWPIDLAAKGSSQVGGNLSTNAGGIRVIRYGHARHWVTGIEVATMKGEILKLGGPLLKNNAGLELAQLFIGSEGILGIITQATLKLTAMPRGSRVFFFSVAGGSQGLELLGHALLQGRLQLLGFEFLTHSCLEVVCEVQGKPNPVNTPGAAYILVEAEVAGAEQVAELETWMESVFQDGLVLDGVLAASSKENRQIWSYREQITESLGHLGLMHKNDVSVPVPLMDQFMSELEQAIAPLYPGTVHLFGHLGDGNIHVNVRKLPETDADEFLQQCRAVDHTLYALLQRLGGSIAAEHGIGLLKRDVLHYSRGPAEIQRMREVKQVFDPQGLLNPGKVLPIART